MSKRKASSVNVTYNILHFKFVNILGAEGSLSNVDATSDMSVDEEECSSIRLLTASTSTIPEKEDVAIKVRLEIILDNLNYCNFHYFSEINVERK